MVWLKQSTAATLKIGPFVDDSDGKTPETALTISQADVRLSKNGGDFAQKNEASAATHDENGWYNCPVDATDTGTLGRLVLAVYESGALLYWREFVVVPAHVYDGLVAGTDYVQADMVQVEGADATDTLIGADGDTLETLSDQIDNLPSPGTGARTVTFTLTDGSGTAAGSLETHVEDADGNTLAGPLTTNTNGLVTYYLDDATVYLVTPSTSVWQGNSEEVTIDATAESDGVAVTLTAQTLPAPSSADKYTIIINAADEYGDLVGADAWTVKVTDVRPRRLATANLVQLSEENAITIDGNGQGSFEISKETTQFTVEITPTLANATTGETVTITAIVDSDAANDSDQIYLADLQFIE